MEHDHRSAKTITVERISVTTIRARKLYCNVCGEEVDPLRLVDERRAEIPAIDVTNFAADADDPNKNT